MTLNKPWLKNLVAALFWLAVWSLLAGWVDKELLLPSPPAVWHSFCRLVVKADFWLAAAATMLRIVLGFSLGMLGGALLALLMRASRLAAVLFSPLIKAVRAAPVASFIILALVWIAAKRLPVFIAFLMVLPVAWANTDAGLNSIDSQLLEMARIFRLSRFKVCRRIYLPSLRPYLTAASTTGLGLAWKSGVTAEVIAASDFAAIGAELNRAKVTLEMPDMFVWTLVVIVMSLLLEALLNKAIGEKNDSDPGEA